MRSAPKDILEGKSVGQLLADGFTELATDLKSGKDISKKFTCHKVSLDLQPQSYSPNQVKKTRKVLGVSQALFAKFLGFSLNAVRAWEQGINQPPESACRMMDEIHFNPSYWQARIKGMIVIK
jgi:putative transcriptional regulator